MTTFIAAVTPSLGSHPGVREWFAGTIWGMTRAASHVPRRAAAVGQDVDPDEMPVGRARAVLVEGSSATRSRWISPSRLSVRASGADAADRSRQRLGGMDVRWSRPPSAIGARPLPSSRFPRDGSAVRCAGAQVVLDAERTRHRDARAAVRDRQWPGDHVAPTCGQIDRRRHRNRFVHISPTHEFPVARSSLRHADGLRDRFR